jgi:hypothetical protein
MVDKRDTTYKQLINSIAELLQKHQSFISHNGTLDPHINNKKMSERINNIFQIKLNAIVENYNKKYSKTIDPKKVLNDAEETVRKANKAPSAKKFILTEVIEVNLQNKTKNI